MTKEIAKIDEKGGVPAWMDDRLSTDAGKGLSTSAEDNLVPMIYLLDAKSKVCMKRTPDYIEGAEAGKILLRNTGIPPVPGETGILFQPCYFSKDWVEWKPDRKGFVARHKDRPADAVQVNIDAQHPDRLAWVRKDNGNIVVETRYHVGYVLMEDMEMPFVIPMSSTAHTVSKGWMARMNAKVANGRPAPSWACLYRLTSRPTSNAYGDFMTWVVDDAGWVETLAAYERGAKLNASFEAGEKAMEAETNLGGAADDGRNTM